MQTVPPLYVSHHQPTLSHTPHPLPLSLIKSCDESCIGYSTPFSGAGELIPSSCPPLKVSAGGSLANTLVSIARLTTARHRHQPLRVAMGGLIGGDALGAYVTAQLQAAGVELAEEPAAETSTGTVMVLNTPDAQRSFLSYFPSDELVVSPALEAAVCNARVVLLEVSPQPPHTTAAQQTAHLLKHVCKPQDNNSTRTNMKTSRPVSCSSPWW